MRGRAHRVNGSRGDRRREAPGCPREDRRNLTPEGRAAGEAGWSRQRSRIQRPQSGAVVFDRSGCGRSLLGQRCPTHGTIAQVVRVLCPTTRACLFRAGHRRYWSRRKPRRGAATSPPRFGGGRRQFTRRWRGEGSAFTRVRAQIVQKTGRGRGRVRWEAPASRGAYIIGTSPAGRPRFDADVDSTNFDT